ncbi:hypothetical protein MHJ22_09130, partial [Acinetobacter baumannii]|uniref:Y-family DNA polymerase n=1 Tax=Acinetobacter baumannii TaxID=470 RepID=UPI001EFC443C
MKDISHREVYALVDINNCYVSCERLFNPKLNDKAVVVLSNNDGCVVSRSEDYVIYAELSGDFPLGDSRQPTYKSLRP